MTIKIYKPSKTSMQSGFKKTKLWLAEYISEVEKVKDSLMGWNSSLDTKSQIKLFFDTKEQAIEWAKKNNYQVKIANNQNMKKYIDLFTPSYDSYKSIFEYIKSLNDENEINSHAVEFLNLSSLISLGYIWLHYIEISLAKLEKKDESFYKSKIETGNFFLTKLLSETQVLCQNIKSGGKYYNDYNDKYFETAI